jgi:hypothetical protein
MSLRSAQAGAQSVNDAQIGKFSDFVEVEAGVALSLVLESVEHIAHLIKDDG